MKKLLATTLLLPALALAQVPIRPPEDAPVTPPAQRPSRPVPRPTSPTSPPSRPTVTPGGAPPSAAPARPAPRGQGEGEATITPANGRCVPMQGRFMLSFNKADVVDVLEQASRWTCRNFIYTDDVARGKITLLSKTAVTAEEAYAAFLAAMNANNITVYPTGKYYRLGRAADGKKLPIPTYTDPSSGTPASEQVITKVIRLQFADADQLRGVLGNFISPQGADLQAIPPDTLIITDIGLNIRRIERMIDAIDKVGGGDMVRLVQIRFASAKDVADKVNQIFQVQGTGKAARRTLLSTPAAPATRATPRVTPTPAAPQAGGAVEVSVSKVLPDERTNKLIVIADEKSYQRILELVEQLDVPTSGEGGIHVVFLKNANAEEMATTLSNLAQGQAAAKKVTPAAPPGVQYPTGARPVPTATPQPQQPGGETAVLFAGDVKITSDKTQNALLVQASGADFAAMSRLIEKLDRARRQVFVEAVIMEVNLNDETQLGVGAHYAVPFKYKGDNGVIPLVSQPGRVSSLNLGSVIQLGGFLTGFAGPVSAELKDLGLGNLSTLGILVQALQSNSDVNVLSTPHLLATDNEESEITVGQNVPFQAGYAPQGLSNLLSGTTTGTTGNTIGNILGTGGLSSLYAPIQRQNVELRLKIKPQVNEGGNIRLTIEEQTEEIASNDPQLGPTTAKRSVKTQIVAKDASTIVIGGLIQDRSVRSVKKIPFFGSLPILGWLFRDTTTTKQKTNLLLFLTPYIIRDEADYRRIYERKRKEQQEFLEQFYGRQTRFEVAVDFERKSGPYAKLHAGVAEETGKVENGGTGLPGERFSVPPSDQPFRTPAPTSPAPAPVPPPPGTPGEEPSPGGTPSGEPEAQPGTVEPSTPEGAPAEPAPPAEPPHGERPATPYAPPATGGPAGE
jgi:general secretion pathway protein D